MRVGIIGRTEILYDTAQLIRRSGYEIAFIITAKEAPEYTKTSSDFKMLAKDWGIPFLHTSRITDAVDFIQSCDPIDVGVSINYSGIIPKSVTDLFHLGVLNAHGGDLPRYRGNACQAWAILNGEDRVGLCIHRMIGGELDNGDIISRDYFPLDVNTKITAVYQWMSKKIPVLFSEALQSLQENPQYILESQSKDPKDALRCYPRKPEDGQIDWNKSAKDIMRLVNACNKPYAGAFCYLEGERMTIWDAEVSLEDEFLAIPGQVTMLGDDFVEVAAGKGRLKVKEVEYKGEVTFPSMLIKSMRKRFS